MSQPGGTYVPIRYQTSVDLDEEQITIGFAKSGYVHTYIMYVVCMKACVYV